MIDNPDYMVWTECSRGIIEFTQGTRPFTAGYTLFAGGTLNQRKLVASAQVGHQTLIVQRVFKSEDIVTSIANVVSLFRQELIRNGL
jgi:hypothetical protein